MFLAQYPILRQESNNKDRHSITMRVRRHNRSLRMKKVFKKTYIG